MIRKRTVFVLGAGTGVDFGMPLGSDLTLKISESLTQTSQSGYGGYQLVDEMIEDAIRYGPPSDASAKKSAAEVIRKGVLLARSIDEFLETFANDANVLAIGKMSIVSAILKAEQDSKLFVNPDSHRNSMQFLEVYGSWLQLLFQLLAAGLAREDRENIFDNVAFINFNYDRCLEHYFQHAVAARFAVDLSEACAIAKRAKIIHPYGFLGDVVPHTQNRDACYGHHPNIDLKLAAEQIGIYTERKRIGQALLGQLHAEMTQAESIIFLGFAFHDQNLDLLVPKGGIRASAMFSTTKGMSEHDVVLARNWMKSLRNTGEPLVETSPDACADFVRKFQKSIVK